MDSVVSPRDAAAGLKEFWSPRVIGEVNDSYVKVAKLQGQLVWHKHDEEDELFLILKGRLKIELDGRDPVEVEEGDFFIVPKGLSHNPIAGQECHVLLIERKSTKHTGNVITEKTRSIEDQLKGM
jgi:mannose-6-phosphate isomerase-like protein (cupin superfamily)